MVSKVPLIKPTKANRPRNGFDLSQNKHFTAHAGMLLPVMCLDLIIGDHVEITAKDFMRTLPMNSAAFLSLRGVYEFYFVPYSDVWTPFEHFVTSMTDYRSSLQQSVHGQRPPSHVPYFNLDALLTRAHDSVTQSVTNDKLGYPWGLGAQRLLDLLGYGRKYTTGNAPYPLSRRHGTSNYLDYNCNALRLAAYQKIYQDYYMNTQYESRNVKRYSLDSYTGVIPDSDLVELTKLQYRNARSDYYTNVRSSQLFTFGIPFPSSGLQLGETSESATDSVSFDGSSAFIDGDVSLGTGELRINVSSIRSAFALDKLLSVTMRAGKTFADQIAAHYGVELPKGEDGRCTYLGGFDSNVTVSDVDQTSGTTQTGAYSPVGGYLGRTVGKGVGSGSGKIVCDAPKHGILMCIYSLVPAMQYDSTRIDPMVSKLGRFDYFTPEFENLGLQPLESQFVSTFTGSGGHVVGYQPRYSEYKTALDTNHGQFNVDDALSFYTIGRFRTDVRFPTIDESDFKIDPRWLDSVFLVNYNGYELSDCVFGGCYFNVLKVSNMSVDGMPRV